MPPLAGLYVVDFTTLLPGPFASLMLAEAGAEILKIEPPRGDDMRRFPPLVNGESAAFAALNAGKTFLRLDLKDPAAIAGLKPHLERADIILEQFRPGVMDRLGLGYQTIRAFNPRVIYCSITGYGQTGPRANEAGHDLNYISRTGMLSLSTGGADKPTLPPLLAADIAGGSFPAMINILLGLRQRDQTGEGCYIDIAMADTPASFAWHAAATLAVSGRSPLDGAELFTGGSPRYHTYPTLDRRLVAVGALEDKFWNVFCDAIGVPELLRVPSAPPATVIEFISQIIATKPARHWKQVLEPLDACVCVVATLEEATTDPHFILRGLFSRRTKLADGTEVPCAHVPVAAAFRKKPR
ncbi:MAG TPA: CaiB/BaiF CoA-transferase family protein [Beijerinckiaceae bacterium]|nr:CaiB/BaiF CoA-transferase family protein [Beijerinckiaceae bacterium]